MCLGRRQFEVIKVTRRFPSPGAIAIRSCSSARPVSVRNLVFNEARPWRQAGALGCCTSPIAADRRFARRSAASGSCVGKYTVGRDRAKRRIASSVAMVTCSSALTPSSLAFKHQVFIVGGIAGQEIIDAAIPDHDRDMIRGVTGRGDRDHIAGLRQSPARGERAERFGGQAERLRIEP